MNHAAYYQLPKPGSPPRGIGKLPLAHSTIHRSQLTAIRPISVTSIARHPRENRADHQCRRTRE